jgi:hypothetical protein
VGALAANAMIRASYTKLALRHFKTAEAKEYPELLSAIGPDVMAEIRNAGSLEWLPARVHAKVADSTVSHFGARASRALWRDVMMGAFERGMLRPLVGGALRLYGRNPASIMKMTPQGWSLVWRECGRAWMDSVSPRHARMRFEGLPRVIVDSPGIVDSFVANCEAAVAYLKCHGQINAHRDQLAAGRFDIDVTWVVSEQAPSPR